MSTFSQVCRGVRGHGRQMSRTVRPDTQNTAQPRKRFHLEWCLDGKWKRGHASGPKPLCLDFYRTGAADRSMSTVLNSFAVSFAKRRLINHSRT